MQGTVGIAAQNLAYREKQRFIVAYHAAVGRYAHFTIGKGVEGVDRFVRRSTGLQMYEYLGLCSGYIVDFPYFYFPFVVCFQYRVDDDRCCLAIRYFGNGESPLISFFDFARTLTEPPRSPSLYRATSMNPPVWKSG